MKTIETLAGDNVYDTFKKAYEEFNHEEVVTFHHNGCQVMIIPDNAEWVRRASSDHEYWKVKRLHEWAVGNHTGISSKTLWMAMLDIEPKNNMMVDIPYDADDFSRCFYLMRDVDPEYRLKALRNVGNICPAWFPIAREWNKLEHLYLKGREEGDYSEFTELLNELRKEVGK